MARRLPSKSDPSTGCQYPRAEPNPSNLLRKRSRLFVEGYVAVVLSLSEAALSR